MGLYSILAYYTIPSTKPISHARIGTLPRAMIGLSTPGAGYLRRLTRTCLECGFECERCYLPLSGYQDSITSSITSSISASSTAACQRCWGPLTKQHHKQHHKHHHKHHHKRSRKHQFIAQRRKGITTKRKRLAAHSRHLQSLGTGVSSRPNFCCRARTRGQVVPETLPIYTLWLASTGFSCRSMRVQPICEQSAWEKQVAAGRTASVWIRWPTVWISNAKKPRNLEN